VKEEKKQVLLVHNNKLKEDKEEKLKSWLRREELPIFKEWNRKIKGLKEGKALLMMKKRNMCDLCMVINRMKKNVKSRGRRPKTVEFHVFVGMAPQGGITEVEIFHNEYPKEKLRLTFESTKGNTGHGFKF